VHDPKGAKNAAAVCRVEYLRLGQVMRFFRLLISISTLSLAKTSNLGLIEALAWMIVSSGSRTSKRPTWDRRYYSAELLLSLAPAPPIVAFGASKETRDFRKLCRSARTSYHDNEGVASIEDVQLNIERACVLCVIVWQPLAHDCWSSPGLTMFACPDLTRTGPSLPVS
jgi:hypothetical protein